MAGPQTLVPEIRFRGFSDEWEERELGDTVSLRGRIGFRGYTQADLVEEGNGAITFSPADIDETGNVSQTDNKYISWMKYEESPEIKVQPGDILFTKTASIGKVGFVRELKEKATINPQFALLTPLKGTDGYFTFLAIRTDAFMKQVRDITGGSSVPTMSQEKLKELTFMSPSLEEQNELGAIFENLNNLITFHRRKHGRLKNIKKSMLEKMFPCDGSNVPEIRFAGFTNPWEQRKVSEVCSISTGKSNTQDKIDDGAYPFYVRSPIVERSNRYLYDEEAVLTVGDGVGTGKVFHYVHGKYDLHQRVYRLFGFSDDVDAKFFYHWFSENFYNRVMSMTAKTSVDSVRLEMIADMEMIAPSYPEQRKIASYLDHLDNLITLHQRKYEMLQKLKNSLLQKMLV